MSKNKIIDVLCFIVSPSILGGLIADQIFREELQVGFATIAIAFIMFGIVRGKWRKEDKDK